MSASEESRFRGRHGDDAEPAGVVRFGRFELKADELQLLGDGVVLDVGPRAIEVLKVLAGSPGRLVSKQELFERAWPDVVVCDANLNVQISNLRKAIGRDLIVTVPGRGYRFIGRPEARSAPDVASAPATSYPQGDAGQRLIGRDSDLEAIDALLRQGRLVTVAGAGGVGKTRVARRVQQMHRDSADCPAFMVDLAPLADDEQICRQVASAVGTQLGAGPPAPALAAALLERSVLLVLDNAEHLVDQVAAVVQALLDGAPGVRLLVTSQVPLRLASESIHWLAALSLPTRRDDVAEARRHSAVELFVERVRATDRHFDLAADNVASIVDICRKLDGLPLALELAAARVPALGLSTMASGLLHRFRLLTAGERLADARHATLFTAFEWSYRLLDEAERTVFCRLSVFTADFPLVWARAVASDGRIDEWSVVESLAELVDRSLVMADDGDPPRYRLPESARIFAAERLAESGGEVDVRRRHARAMRDWFAAAYEEFFAGSVPVDQWRRQREREVGDGMAALQWAAENDPQTAIVLAPALDWAILTHPWRERMRVWELTQGLLDDRTDPALRSRWTVGFAALAMNNLIAAARVGFPGLEKAVADIRAEGSLRDRYLSARFLIRIVGGEDLESCMRLTRQLVDEQRRLEDVHWAPALRYHGARARADLCRMQGDLEGSIRELMHAAELARRAGDSLGKFSAWVQVLDTEVLAGKFDDAARHGERLVAEQAGTPFVATMCHAGTNRAAALIGLGRIDEARRVFAQSWGLAARFGLLSIWAPHLALLAIAEGRAADAARIAGMARATLVAAPEIFLSLEENALGDAERLARAALGPAEFDRCAADGATLSDADLRRYALGQA